MKKIFSTLLLIVVLLCGCKKTTTQEALIYSMNTLIKVTLYNANDENLEDIKKIYQEYHKLSNMYESYNNINNVYTINNSDDYVEVDDKLLELLKFANRDILGYNVLIGELSQLYKKVLETKDLTLINEEVISLKLKNMNDSKLLFKDNKVMISGEGKVDLGAVSKGYATKIVKGYLKEKNITSYLIDAGNSSVLLGYKNKNEKFKIGLKNIKGNSFYKILNINNKSIATSSISEQNVTIEGKTYNHIINPLTGYNANKYDIVTIIGDDSALLDIYSTAFFNIELEDIKSISSSLDFEVIVVKDNKVLYESSGIKAYD